MAIQVHLGTVHLLLKNRGKCNDMASIRVDTYRYGSTLVIGSYVLIHVAEDREISPALLERISHYDHDKVHRRLLQKRLNGTGQWFLAKPEFQAWRTRAGHPCLWCSGKGMQWLTDINRRILMCSRMNSWLGKNNDRVGSEEHHP